LKRRPMRLPNFIMLHLQPKASKTPSLHLKKMR
uniref:Capsid protein n=1 Tax=Haemonchus placei TaxID=6290 RepID=A0A0N4VZW8_HAEPC